MDRLEEGKAEARSAYGIGLMNEECMLHPVASEMQIIKALSPLLTFTIFVTPPVIPSPLPHLVFSLIFSFFS